MTAILSPSAKVMSPILPEFPDLPEHPAEDINIPAESTALRRMRLMFMIISFPVIQEDQPALYTFTVLMMMSSTGWLFSPLAFSVTSTAAMLSITSNPSTT